MPVFKKVNWKDHSNHKLASQTSVLGIGSGKGNLEKIQRRAMRETKGLETMFIVEVNFFGCFYMCSRGGGA